MKTLQSFFRWLAEIEIWVVGLCTGAALISVRALPIAVTVGLLFWPIRWAATGRVSVRTAADWGIAGLAAMSAVSVLVSAFPQVTQIQVLRLLTGILFFYAIANWSGTERRMRWAAQVVMGTSLLVAGSAVISVEWPAKLSFIPTGVYERFTILLSDTTNPNVMGGTLVYLLPIGLGLLLFAWKNLAWYEKALATFASLAGLAVLVLTQSRGAWLGLAGGLAVLLALRWKFGWTILAGVLILLAVWVGIAGGQNILEAVGSNASLGGLEGRLEVWSRAIYMIQDFPITGIGMGNFSFVTDQLYPLFLNEPGKIPHAHQLLLQVGVDLGIPGLISWLAIFGTVLLSGILVYSSPDHPGTRWMRGLGAGILASQAALILHGTLDAVGWGMVRPAPLVWMVWGVAAAAANLGKVSGARDGERKPAI